MLLWASCGSSGTTASGDLDAQEDAQGDASGLEDLNSDGNGGTKDQEGMDVAEDSNLDTLPEDCVAGDTACINGKLAVCDEVYGWLLENCPEGSVCEDGECVDTTCEPPLARMCDGNAVVICSPEGAGWSDPMPCPEGFLCVQGTCVTETCESGTVECIENNVAECNEDGTAWTLTPCDEGQSCFNGLCIDCVKDSECEEGLVCVEGTCAPLPLSIVTASLPDGKVGDAYTATIVATGGTAPYLFDVAEASELPAGIELDADTGELFGTPTAAGDYELELVVTDAAEDIDSHVYSFKIFPPEQQVIITTGSPLPTGEEGTPYSVTFAATGGEAPYIWGISQGEIPVGLSFSSNGTLEGTPADHGTFTFKVKAFDNSDEVNVGSKEFELTLKIAPLEIIGDQELDLWITKVIVLPLLTAIQGIPLPYNQNLQAKGGVKPYHWTETDISGAVSWLIPNAGIPVGLTLDDNGLLHGSVTDPDAAVSINVPFVNINVTGFFFVAKVTDSQDSPDSATAIYLIPTIPVSF